MKLHHSRPKEWDLTSISDQKNITHNSFACHALFMITVIAKEVPNASNSFCRYFELDYHIIELKIISLVYYLSGSFQMCSYDLIFISKFIWISRPYENSSLIKIIWYTIFWTLCSWWGLYFLRVFIFIF